MSLNAPDSLPSDQSTHPKYRADIDGLRAIAVLSVIGFHAFPDWMHGGFVGVDIFFVISGFLISTIIFKNLEHNSFSLIEFYSRRIKRIFPALLIVLITSYAFGWLALLADEYKQLGKHIAAGAGFISNLVLWSESDYFDNTADTKPLLHLWSLGVEEQFYIVWPLVLWATWKTRSKLLTITLVLAIISFAFNLWGVQTDAVATFYSPQTRFWELFIGSLLAWLTLHRQAINFPRQLDHCTNIRVNPQTSIVVRCALFNGFAWLGAALIAAALSMTTKTSQFPGWWALLPTLGTALVIAAGAQAWLNRVVLSNRILVWFGLISFPLYLWHWPLLSFARIVESEIPSNEIKITAVLLSIVLAWLTYTLIEKPIRFGTRSNVNIFILMSLIIITGCVGYATYKGDGLRFRDPSTKQSYLAQKIEQQFNDKCSRHFDKISHCAEQITSGNEIILLVGDSHVRHTYELIKKQVSNANYGLVAFSNGGCPFLLEINTSNVSDCALKNREILGFIRTNAKIIKAIVIAAEFTTYTVPGWLQDTKGKTVHLDRALHDTLELLQNIPVIVFEQAPPISFDPKKCLSRPYRISHNDFNCQSSYANVMALMKASRQATHKAIQPFSNITLFNIDNVLCRSDVCSALSQNNLLYYDKTHLNPIGVDFVRDRIHFDKAISASIAQAKKLPSLIR